MRNLLGNSSVAQSLDGEPSDGESAFPRNQKLVVFAPDRKRLSQALHSDHSQWRRWWDDRSCRNCHDDLVRSAGLAEGQPAHGVSARWSRDLSHECHRNWHPRNRVARNSAAFLSRAAGLAGGELGWPQALRQARRSGLPHGRIDCTFGVWSCINFLESSCG